MRVKPRRVDGGDRWMLHAALVCFALAFFFLSLIVLAGCAHTTTGRALNAGVVASGVADLITTQQALDRGGREWNRLLGDDVWRQALLKTAGVTGVIGLAWVAEQKGHPILAHVIRGAAIGLWTAAAISNARVGR